VVFITKVERVYSAVRTESLYKTDTLHLKRVKHPCKIWSLLLKSDHPSLRTSSNVTRVTTPSPQPPHNTKIIMKFSYQQTDTQTTKLLRLLTKYPAILSNNKRTKYNAFINHIYIHYLNFATCFGPFGYLQVHHLILPGSPYGLSLLYYNNVNRWRNGSHVSWCSYVHYNYHCFYRTPQSTSVLFQLWLD
jgi:hypothetical protein